MVRMCVSLFNPIRLVEMLNAKIIFYNPIAHSHMLEICKIQFYVNGIQQLTHAQPQKIQVI